MSHVETAGKIFWHVVDPRGRCDRRAMLVTTLALLGTQMLLLGLFLLFGGSPESGLFLALNLPLMWIGTAVLLKRLHDVGWSGWWIVPAVLFWLVGSFLILFAVMMAVGVDRFVSALALYPALHAALVVVIAIPLLGGLLWLQASPGMAGPNRFGPAPDDLGFARAPAKAPLPVELPGAVASA